eukprot:jgi/Astpho2/9686/Aster-x0865
MGISYMELLVILGVGSLMLGPKDLPKLGRYAGLATGRAAAYATAARNRFTTFAQEAQITKLHSEMQQSMQQLQAIKAELSGNINFLNPGPAARRVMQAVGAPADPATAQQQGKQPPSQQHGQAKPLTPELQQQAQLLARALHAQALQQAGNPDAAGEALQPDLQRRAEQLALKLLAAQLVAPSSGSPAQGQAHQEQAQK